MIFFPEVLSLLFGQSNFSCAIKSFLFLQSVDQSSSVSIFCFFLSFLADDESKKKGRTSGCCTCSIL